MSGVLSDIEEASHANPLVWTAEGIITTGNVWIPFTPVTVTADGAGNPPATVIVPLVAALRLDVMVWMSNDDASGAGQHIHNFRTDPLAAVGGITPVIPPWADVQIPVPAGGSGPPNTYGHRMVTDTVASAFGIAEGANADWPNAASVTYYGFYRTVA